MNVELGSLSTIVDLLQTTHPIVQLNLLNVGHIVAVAVIVYPDLKTQPFFRGFISFTIRCVGGSSMGAILAGIPVPFLCSNGFLPCMILVFCMLRFIPPVYHILIHRTVSPILWLLSTCAWCASIANGADILPQFPMLSLVTGTLGGCGGGLLTQSGSLLKSKWALRAPQDYSMVLLALTLAMIYTILLRPLSRTLLFGTGILLRTIPYPSTGNSKPKSKKISRKSKLH